VITIGEPCHAHAAKRAAKPHPHARIPAPVHVAPAAPAAPVVHELAAVSPASTASPPHRAATPPRPARPAPRPRAAESKSLDPLAASTKAGELVAAVAAVPPAGGARYELMLTLLLAMLGAAALWSYGGTRRYRFWRWR
jgi:hypothetical protein